MQYTINGCVLEFVQGDITDQAVDAIVNAANQRLAGGGGVDGAIHRAGGPTIMEETGRRYPDGCPTGSAVLTGAGDLPATYVLHAVGPVWSGGHRGEDERLASAYRRCLELAAESGCRSVAFPSLSTGAYRFPMDRAARIAIGVVNRFLSDRGEPSLVRFVLFSADILGCFTNAARELSDKSSSQPDGESVE